MDMPMAAAKAVSKIEEYGFDVLTEPEKVLATIWLLEAEVNNGGFDQFFF